MFKLDKLNIYAGDNVRITDKIEVLQPTLYEIRKFGEQDYFHAVHLLCASGSDLKWQLYQQGIDFTKISDYEIFCDFTHRTLFAQKLLYNTINANEELLTDDIKKYLNAMDDDEIEKMSINPLQLVLNVDLSEFVKKTVVDQNGFEKVILYNESEDITIDKLVFLRIVEAIRAIHFLKRNNETPANEATKMDMIDDARDDYFMAKNKEYDSILLPLISAISVECGMCGSDNKWDMKINELLYNVRRMNKIDTAKKLLQGAYSGFASLKGVDKELLDWYGKL